MLKLLSGTSVPVLTMPTCNKHLRKLSVGVCLLLSGTLVNASQVSEAELVEAYPVFQQAQDLNYGSVLYEYHQGNYFEALSALNVAKLKSGIQGHGQHPDLVEGGLMLAYGMIDDAKAVFDSLLKKQISPSDRNQAWYYLGKVFYLMEKDELSDESFKKVQEPLFEKKNKALYHEMLYLQGQLVSRDEKLDAQQKQSALGKLILRLPKENIWRKYLEYNAVTEAIMALEDDSTEQDQQSLINTLQALADSLHEYDDEERLNLREQSLLSLGQIYLQLGRDQLAFDSLKGIRKDGFLSDQALFAYAVAATNLERYGLALEALTQLKERPLFTPWIQQVPYALAYLYEQMSEPALALQAYRVAESHYESIITRIQETKQGIDEGQLLDALGLSNKLGSENITSDAYGKLSVLPTDFSFSHLLANESFQRQLSDLHELYKLEQSLKRWDAQLDSFETMMTTRIALREQKVLQTNEAMQAQNAEMWEFARQDFSQQLQLASETEDLRFFMDEEQIRYGKKLSQAEETLALIPKDHRKRVRYERRLNRVKAYYDWWLSESFSQNRWRAMKEFRELDREMSDFHQHQDNLQATMSSDGGNEALALRVSEGRARLSEIRSELQGSLAEVREALLILTKQDYDKQISEADVYLRASREALARLSDQLYHQMAKEESSAKEVLE